MDTDLNMNSRAVHHAGRNRYLLYMLAVSQVSQSVHIVGCAWHKKSVSDTSHFCCPTRAGLPSTQLHQDLALSMLRALDRGMEFARVLLLLDVRSSCDDYVYIYIYIHIQFMYITKK